MPALIAMLGPKRGEAIIDLGCGAGALFAPIHNAGASYIGIDLSPTLIKVAKNHHKEGAFIVGDVTRLNEVRDIKRSHHDGATFLLSIQDINPLFEAIQGAAWALKPGGRMVLCLTHPCFRVPRQSGWGWDEKRKLKYRRIDRYMTELDVPMEQHKSGAGGVTRSYHRPLSAYCSALFRCGFVIDDLSEVAAPGPQPGAQEKKSDRIAREDFPMFLCLRGIKRLA